MFRNPPKEQENRSYGNLDTIRDAFEFDPSDGIYKPKTYYKETKRKRIKRVLKNFRNHWAPMILSAVTLYFVIRYTHYARLQWIETEAAAVAAAEAAHAALSSADTAAAALTISRKQFRMENRPYMWASPEIAPNIHTGIKQLWPHENGIYRIAWTVHVKNGGRSPAKDEISTPSETHIVDKAKFAQEVRKYIPHYLNGPGVVSVPDTGGTVVTDPSPDVSEAEYALIQQGDKIVYVIGGIKYRDIFDPIIDAYETKYCFVYLPVGMPVGTCGEGNTIK